MNSAQNFLIEFLHTSDDAELHELRRTIRRFTEARWENRESAAFRREDFSAMAVLGLTGAAISEKKDGSGLNAFSIAELIFELAREQLGPTIYLSVHFMVSRLIERWGEGFDPLLRDLASGKKLAAFCLTEATAGSDAAALKTKAERQGANYTLTGEKIFITSGGVADIYLVFARTSEDKKKGISAFVVEKDATGLSFGPPEKKMGCEGSPITTVTFENCIIPENARVASEGDGYKIALSGLAGGRVNIAAAACGLASRALALALDHARAREQFGQPIGEFQGMQFLLAEMAMKLRASILLTREAAQSMGNREVENVAAAVAKCFATDSAMQVTTDAVQIFGGAGYLQDYGVERLMRDAKMLQIVEGTNQIQRGIIGGALVGA